jgi:hypothetical protein
MCHPKALLFWAFAFGMCVSCTPTFERGGKSQEQFDRDSAECRQDNTRRTAARYGPSHHADWTGYAACMNARGYFRE